MSLLKKEKHSLFCVDWIIYYAKMLYNTWLVCNCSPTSVTRQWRLHTYISRLHFYRFSMVR